MKQILQSLRSGTTEIADVPCPMARPGHLLIQTSRTLISAGTERMLVEFGKAGWVEKARRQPEKVAAVLDKIKTDGLAVTLEAVRNKLDQPLPLGYCSAGIVLEGDAVRGFRPGDRVVSNGRHAEVASVPVNLTARIPDGVTDDAGAFTVLGAIALQGIRLADPTLGESVAVIGLGLIGLLAVQLLRANGCRVIGVDFDPGKLALARTWGAEVCDLSTGADPVNAAVAFSRGRGVDAVLITASTASDEPIRQAAQMCRQRGRIVLIGQAGLQLTRGDFYEKELTFQVSCSYGPGRYDPAYEEKGCDYPLGFVRWTEQRNFEAVLDMLADGRIDVAPLVSHRFPITRANEAYDLITGGGPSLGILLDYPTPAEQSDDALRRRSVPLAGARKAADQPCRCVVGFIGGGNYAGAVLIPAFKAAGARLKTVASRDGVSGVHAGRKHGFESTTTDVGELFDDADIDAVVVATRHDSHAALAIRALEAGKHVFVEKPLAITTDSLAGIEAAHAAASGQTAAPILMVGFNRRFSPLTAEVRRLLGAVTAPKAFVMTVNAGSIPTGHWTHDPEAGGGRIVGECCHFIDLLRFLAGAPIRSHHVQSIRGGQGDTATVDLAFGDGSIGSVHYFANGSKSFPKERLEVFAGGSVLQLDNFRRLRGFGWPKFRGLSLWRQDKGQAACAAAFLEAVREGGAAPIPFAELAEVSKVCIEVAQDVRGAS
jgi:predicted dehydrogenase/threonine dehydrogenase-like Zn-dependent dehydrogenase